MLLDELPHKLRVKLQMYIYESRYKYIKYLKGKTYTFVAWISHML